MFNRVYVKSLLLLFSGATVLGGLFSAVSITIIRILNLLHLNMDAKEIVQRMRQALRLRNILVLLLLNIVFFTINTQYASTKEQSFYVNYVLTDSITHVLLVSISFFCP